MPCCRALDAPAVTAHHRYAREQPRCRMCATPRRTIASAAAARLHVADQLIHARHTSCVPRCAATRAVAYASTAFASACAARSRRAALHEFQPADSARCHMCDSARRISARTDACAAHRDTPHA